VGEPIGNEK